MKKYICILMTLIFLDSAGLLAQHRGDNLSFQGLLFQSDPSVKVMALGGAYTASSGDVSSLFYNPAGLADISDLQVSIAANSSSNLWRENQEYRPNRIYWTLPFYLEGLYIPDPANNGEWDYDLAQDSAYVVSEPDLGLDPHSEEAADWQKEQSKFLFNNLALAYPFKFSDQKFVVSAAYHSYRIYDFDRNDTYLDPHIGFDLYDDYPDGPPPRVVTDTLDFTWSRFERDRSGDMVKIFGALAYQVTEDFKVGLGITSYSGETDDYQSLERVGNFKIAHNNRFSFTYDTVNSYVSGTSKISGLSYNLGAVFSISKISLGINLILPYTLERSWSYTSIAEDSTGSEQAKSSGKDKMELPASLALGLNVQPTDNFMISFDYQFTKFSNSNFLFDWNNTTHRDWIDQHILRFGVQYRPIDFLTLMAGYRDIPMTYVPDGAAVKEKGPSAVGVTFGVSLEYKNFGRLDLAYELRRLKYYDSYFSNANYVTEHLDNFAVAYTYTF